MSKKPSDPRPRPRIARSRLMVAVCRDIDHELRCAREFGLGAEVQTFSLPHILAGDFSRDLARMAKRLEAVPGPIGCHGPFIDTTHFSQELEVRAVARMRYLQAIDIAEAVGARYVLFHSQYNPLIKIRAYADIYHEGSMAFWPEILAEAKRRRLDVYLENMFDDTPAPLCRLARALDAPNLKLCLDVAHARIFSDVDWADWIDAYGPYLRHVHLNDCHGELDDHLGLGQGSLDLDRAFRLLKQTRLPLTYALETGRNTRASLRYLGVTKQQAT